MDNNGPMNNKEIEEASKTLTPALFLAMMGWDYGAIASHCIFYELDSIEDAIKDIIAKNYPGMFN